MNKSSSMRAWVLMAAAIVAAASWKEARGSLTTVRIATDLERPLFLTAPTEDPRLFVVEQGGTIKIVEDGSVLATPFLDISSFVLLGPDIESEERGLLGLTFAPDYATSGLFYVLYVAPPEPGVVTLARYRVMTSDPDRADPATARVLLRIPKPPSAVSEAYHNGGTIAFDRDGLMVMLTGDGQGYYGNDPGNCAQNDTSPLGKMLRFNPSSFPAAGITVPSASPCPGPIDPLITVRAKGFRNPYRFSFDRETGDLYIGDVGEDSREEIDIQTVGTPSGRNYGWRVMEGTLCNPNLPPDPFCGDPSLTPPDLEYPHTTGGLCGGTVIGGYVYRGVIPEIRGHYFYADYCQQTIQSFEWEGGISSFVERTAELTPVAGVIDNVVAFGEDGFGELYIVDLPIQGGPGEVYRISSTTLDSDHDTVPDYLDNCPVTVNANQADSDGDGRGDLCDFTLLTPADGILFSGPVPPPTFNWAAGTQSTFQLQFSTSQSPFVPLVLPSKKFLGGTSYTPKKKKWKKVQKLGRGGVPVYWRVVGKSGNSTLVTPSDQVFVIHFQD